MNKSPEQVWDAIQALDLSPIKFKLLDPKEGKGWPREYVDQVEQAYRRYLFLAFKYRDQPVVPSIDIDTFWHYHILDTLKYAEDCQQIFGYFLHHFPYFGMRGEEDATNLQNASVATLKLYEQEFNEPLDQKVAQDTAPVVTGPVGYCTSGQAAYCTAPPRPVTQSAYCTPARTAYCTAPPQPATQSAYCTSAKTAYCTAPPQPVTQSAYCTPARTAYCTAPPQPAAQSAYCTSARTAYCTAPPQPTTQSAYCTPARTAYCTAPPQPAAQSAYCTSARTAYCTAPPQPVTQSAYCTSARTAYCTPPRQTAYCTVTPATQNAYCTQSAYCTPEKSGYCTGTLASEKEQATETSDVVKIYERPKLV